MMGQARDCGLLYLSGLHITDFFLPPMLLFIGDTVLQVVHEMVPGKGELTQEFVFLLLCYREKCPTLHSANFFFFF